MQIDNQYANELLKNYNKGLNTNLFMDAIAGVNKYDVKDLSRQGCIRGMFAKEIIADQFLIDLKEIVSVFWLGVFENLPKAKYWNEEIEIKVKDTTHKIITNANPIHYLRRQASYAVRNHITSLYKKNLQQTCDICGHTTVVKNNKKCDRCTNGFMSATYKFIEIDDDLDNLNSVSVYRYLEDDSMKIQIEKVLNDFGQKILGTNTRAYQILKILTDPKASHSMCSKCNMCDATSFDIDMCKNYSANIGKYLGVNKTLIATKMRRIRKALPAYLFSEGTVEANYLLDLIPSKFKGLFAN